MNIVKQHNFKIAEKGALIARGIRASILPVSCAEGWSVSWYNSGTVLSAFSSSFFIKICPFKIFLITLYKKIK